jgi:type VI protein secretion system component VasK
MSAKFNINGTDGMDTVVKQFLLSPFDLSMRWVITDAGKVGKQKAGGAAKNFCDALARLQHKFPFDPAATSAEVTLDEFAGVFGTQGSAYATLQQALAKSIVKQGRSWAVAPDADPKLSDEYLRFLNRIGAISDAFFPADANGQAKLHYGLKIEPLTNVEKITLTADGDSTVATTTSSMKQFIWTGAGKEANLQVTIGGTNSFGRQGGIWAIFRLMANADAGTVAKKAAQFSHTRGQGSSLSDVVTDKDGKPVTVTIDIEAATNVFDPSFFAIRCPTRVTE